MPELFKEGWATSNVFDTLQKKLQVDKREQGISTLEIASLPPNLRKIMRLMLREVQLPYNEICTYLESLPDRSA